MGGTRLIPAAAAAVTARRIASWVPRVIAYTLQGYSNTGRHRPAGHERRSYRSGKSEPWVAGEGGRRRRGFGSFLPAAFFVRSRLGRVQPFWCAILSPCLITSRSTRRASG